jgi:hypothetical protein
MYRFREPFGTPLFTGISEKGGSRFVRKKVRVLYGNAKYRANPLFIGVSSDLTPYF